ncbi:hypothetical protein ACXR0O_14635 [Verrucomicrobiota bacterium sgz303538]
MGHLASSSVLAIALAFTACDSRQTTHQATPRSEPPSVSQPSSAGNARSLKQKQADFLNRIRAADPQGKTIDRAVINDQNELGLILDRSVQMDDIPKLMKSMLTQMAREFPGEDLTVIAYAPSNPPRKIGTARLNAQTRDMTYTPEA